MPRSPNFFFPDINVWLALSYNRHVHHRAAKDWFDSLGPNCRLYFCRLTQLGLLRLLCTESVMSRDRALNQRQAWHEYDHWREDERIEFLEEPAGLEKEFRALTQHWLPSPKGWVDAYLSAFSTVAGLPFVTFDQAFRGRVKGVLILEA
jgi:uncharacterized protein